MFSPFPDSVLSVDAMRLDADDQIHTSRHFFGVRVRIFLNKIIRVWIGGPSGEHPGLYKLCTPSTARNFTEEGQLTTCGSTALHKVYVQVGEEWC